MPILEGMVPNIPLLLKLISTIFDPLHVTPVHDGLPHRLVLGTPLAHRHPVRPVMVPRFVDDTKSQANIAEKGNSLGTALGDDDGVTLGYIEGDVGNTVGITEGHVVGDSVGDMLGPTV